MLYHRLSTYMALSIFCALTGHFRQPTLHGIDHLVRVGDHNCGRRVVGRTTERHPCPEGMLRICFPPGLDDEHAETLSGAIIGHFMVLPIPPAAGCPIEPAKQCAVSKRGVASERRGSNAVVTLGSRQTWRTGRVRAS